MARTTSLKTKKHIQKPRARLSVFRSLNHIYAQVIDDANSRTVAAASSLDADVRSEKLGKKDGAARVGSLVAKRAMESGVTQVRFDRRRFKYHGRVKALAEAARQAGLDF